MTSILNVYNSHKCHAYVSIACVRLYVFNSLPKMVRFYALICFDFSFQFISIKFVKSRPTDSFKSFDTRTHANKHPLVAQTHTHTRTHVCALHKSVWLHPIPCNKENISTMSIALWTEKFATKYGIPSKNMKNTQTQVDFICLSNK